MTGLFQHYRNQRSGQAHYHEISRGDKRLYEWVLGFKPFLEGKHASRGSTAPVEGWNVEPLSLTMIVQGYYFHSEWEKKLPLEQRNAMMILRAHQNMRPQRPSDPNLPGDQQQAYSNWRTAWIVECSKHLPPYTKAVVYPAPPTWIDKREST